MERGRGRVKAADHATCIRPMASGAASCIFSMGTVQVFREHETLTYHSTETNYQHIFGIRNRRMGSLTANCSRGCLYDCLYCYAKAMAVRFNQCRSSDGTVECRDLRPNRFR
jgi:hypothetical protein